MPANINELYYRKIPSQQKEKAIIFLHGLGGSHRFWSEEYYQLAENYTLYFVDLLGFGNSAKPNNPYTLERHVQAIETFIGTTVTEPSHILVGHSLGAIITLAYTTLHPSSILKSLLLGLPYYHSLNEAHHIIQQETRYPKWFYTDTIRAKMMYVFLRQLGRPIAQLMSPLLFPNFPPGYIQDIFLHSYMSMTSSIKHVILRQNIPQLMTMPVLRKLLFFHGLQDKLAPFQNVQELAYRFSIPLFTVNGSHGFPFDNSSHTITLIKKYL